MNQYKKDRLTLIITTIILVIYLIIHIILAFYLSHKGMLFITIGGVIVASAFIILNIYGLRKIKTLEAIYDEEA